jgi:hypothetical protein
VTFFCAPKIVRGLDLIVPNAVQRLDQFAGKTMAVRASGRPYAIALWLRMVGLEDKVRMLIIKDEDVGRWGQWRKVASGECIASFIDPLYISEPLRAGLKVLAVPDIAVIGHYAQACTSDFAYRRATLLRSYVQAVIHALCLMKRDRAAALDIVCGEPMQRMGIADREMMARQFAAIVDKLQVKPYPTLEAMRNTYEIAADEYGATGLNPLTLWDLHWIKELDEAGFIDALLNKRTSDTSAAKSERV